MGRKIFVSYKHHDDSVFPLNGAFLPTTARDYVDRIEVLLKGEHIYKGERDNEDLGSFKDSTIESHLRDRIFDSSVTIVLVSPRMKDPLYHEWDQWIPWEISYSLREQTRGGRTRRSNAILAVILPDRQGSYAYYLEDKSCCNTGCRMHRTDTLFQILRENMFNAKAKNRLNCVQGSNVYSGECSYIPSVRWDEFTSAVNGSLARVITLSDNIEQYDIVKELT